MLSKRRKVMKVIFNPDQKQVDLIKEGLKKTEGYCPCKPKFPQNKCPCEEFRNQIADPNWYGLCYCGLYLKTKDDPNNKQEKLQK